jgi:hypothetical protein
MRQSWRFAWTAVPLLGFAAADAWLGRAFGLAQDARQLCAQFVLHALAAWAALQWVWGWLPAIDSRAGRLVGAAAAYLLFDLLVAATTFTGHYGFWLPRTAAALAALGLIVASWRAPAWVERIAQRTPWLALALALTSAAICIGFGFSLSRWTTKHFREFGHALLLYPWALLCMLDALHQPRGTQRRAFAIWLGAAVVLSTSLSAVAPAPERSTYALVTRLWGAPALRRFNRSFAGRLLQPWFHGLDPLVGEPVPSITPRTVPEGAVRCGARAAGVASSALILSIDSLRADYFGLGPAQLPNLERVRARALTFTRAIQASSGTGPSLFAWHTGRYATSDSPSNDVLRAAALSGGRAAIYQTQPWEDPPERFARRIVDELARLGQRDFIAHYHFLSLHPRRNWAGAGFDYRAMLVRLDRALGSILDGLQAQGRLDALLLIVSADHGEELSAERGYQGHGFDVTQALLHTPLLVRAPAGSSQRRDELVSGTDLAPTVLDALGLGCELAMDGRSLLRPPLSERSVFGSSYAPGLSCSEDCRIYADSHAALRDRFKLIYDRGENARALFDLAADPLERDNLIDAQPERARALRVELDSYLAGRIASAEAAHQASPR